MGLLGPRAYGGSRFKKNGGPRKPRGSRVIFLPLARRALSRGYGSPWPHDRTNAWGLFSIVILRCLFGELAQSALAFALFRLLLGNLSISYTSAFIIILLPSLPPWQPLGKPASCAGCDGPGCAYRDAGRPAAQKGARHSHGPWRKAAGVRGGVCLAGQRERAGRVLPFFLLLSCFLFAAFSQAMAGK